MDEERERECVCMCVCNYMSVNCSSPNFVMHVQFCMLCVLLLQQVPDLVDRQRHTPVLHMLQFGPPTFSSTCLSVSLNCTHHCIEHQ